MWLSFVVMGGGGEVGGGGVAVSLEANSGRLTRVRHSIRKSTVTHFYQCEQYFPVSTPWYSCQCLGFLMWARMLMHAIASSTLPRRL